MGLTEIKRTWSCYLLVFLASACAAFVIAMAVLPQSADGSEARPTQPAAAKASPTISGPTQLVVVSNTPATRRAILRRNERQIQECQPHDATCILRQRRQEQTPADTGNQQELADQIHGETPHHSRRIPWLAAILGATVCGAGTYIVHVSREKT